jgi:serine/threonine protein kinase
MAENLLRDNPELRPFVLSNVRLTGTRIGAGAYGSVEEVTIPVGAAAKKIHDIFQDRSEIPDDEIDKASTQFVRECQLMSTLRHPNIVQFLGVCFFPGSRLPALVMERLLTSLHDLLDPETDPPPPPDAPKPFFPLSLKCSILHNAASGLAYLHERSPPIIHRDLSARNVLLNSGMVAKIADLGVARIVPRMRAKAIMTKAPGAGIYMPPEALEAKSEEEQQKSKYDASVDIFSFGVVSIFTLSQTFPCNLLAPNYREGRRHIARTELERRAQYMQMIYRQLRENHPLLQMIERCLDSPEDRPSIGEVLHLLEQARAEERDEQMEMNKLELLRTLQTQPRDQSLMRDVTELQQQLQSSSQQLRRKEAELTRAEETIRREQQLVQAKDRELAQAQQQLRQQEQSSRREIGDLERQLRSSEALVADFQKTLQQRDSELETLRSKTQRPEPPPPQTRTLSSSSASQPQQQSSLQSSRPGPSVTAGPHSIPHYKQGKLTVQCHDKKTAPCGMRRGSATSDLQYAYFMPGDSRSVYRYEWSTEKWEKLPPCPYYDPTLVIIDGALTAVGGYDKGFFSDTPTKKLFTLRQKRWVEELPPMKTARSNAAVVSASNGEYVLVIGGYDDDRWTTTVELFQVKSRRWYTLSDVPNDLSSISATVCGNRVHVMGYSGDGYSCSLRDLSSTPTISWDPLPYLPVTRSTIATLSGQLVIVGGFQYDSSVNSIYQLVDEEWVKIGTMSGDRRMCFVFNPSPDKMMIVGGWRGSGPIDSIEQCTAV